MKLIRHDLDMTRWGFHGLDNVEFHMSMTMYAELLEQEADRRRVLHPLAGVDAPGLVHALHAVEPAAPVVGGALRSHLL